jgi:protein ImuB
MWSIDRVQRRYRRSREQDGRSASPNEAAATLLVREVASRQEVVHACDIALQAGVLPANASSHAGMTLAHARALLGARKVRVLPSDPTGDRDALERLAAWATRFVPLASADMPDDDMLAMPGLLADITGCERLYHGEDNLLRQLLAAVHRLGFRAKVAAAPTFGCAWALARFGEGDVTRVDHHDMLDAIRDLPVRALRVSLAIEAAMVQIGVTTVGQVLDLPRRSLPSRFGAQLTLRIDQALGQAIETMTPVRPRKALSVAMDFAGPVKQYEVIELATRQLLEQLCDRLLHLEAGVRLLDIQLQRSDCEPYTFDLSVSQASRDVKHLWALLRPKLERAHLGYGVEAITLTARRVGGLPHQQHEHAMLGKPSHDATVDRELAQLTDTLTNRLGGQAVCRVEPVATHQPERVMRLVPLSQPTTKHLAPMVRHDRPSVLLPQPRPIRVNAVTPDGPLVQMQLRGQMLRILTTQGPERISPEWWTAPGGSRASGVESPESEDGGGPKSKVQSPKSSATRPLGPEPLTPCAQHARDYFKVQDERGRWWWVYRELPSRAWFVHGGWV